MYFLLGCMCFFSCAQRTMISETTFEQIPIGSSVSKLVKVLGEPYEIKSKKEVAVFIYVQRLNYGQDMKEHRRYLFYLQNGRVIDKKIEIEATPAFGLGK